MAGISVVARKLDPFQQRIADILKENGIELHHILSNSVRIEVRDDFGAVLIGELFIPISLEDLTSEA